MGCVRAQREFGPKFVCMPCFNAAFPPGDYRLTPQYRQAYGSALSRREIVAARNDLAAAGIPARTDRDDGEFNTEPSFDPWDAVDEALDAGLDPVATHDAVAANAWVEHLQEAGERRAEMKRDAWNRQEEVRPPRPSRAAYMREYRRRKKAA